MSPKKKTKAPKKRDERKAATCPLGPRWCHGEHVPPCEKMSTTVARKGWERVRKCRNGRLYFPPTSARLPVPLRTRRFA